MQLTLNGAVYRVRIWGSGPPLLLLHGFSGSGADWAPLAATLAERFRLIAPDLLGHGASSAPKDPARYAMECAAADIIALLDALALERVHLLGYSMGGRLALYLACRQPARCCGLYLESSSPGLATAVERTARAAEDEALAAWIETEGVPAFVDRWEKLPLWTSQTALPPAVAAAQRARQLRNRPIGLANSLRGMGTGVQPPLWSDLSRLHRPVRLLAGALDAKFSMRAQEMAGRLPNAQLHIQPGAGHNVHLEQPSFFAADLAHWLTSTPV
jgi:2-succinyl-6-hydroxy-2,4-cyclohexadiene-1-carboxylate synthase